MTPADVDNHHVGVFLLVNITIRQNVRMSIIGLSDSHANLLLGDLPIVNDRNAEDIRIFFARIIYYYI